MVKSRRVIGAATAASTSCCCWISSSWGSQLKMALLWSPGNWSWCWTARSNHLPTAERISSNCQWRCTGRVRQWKSPTRFIAQRLNHRLLLVVVIVTNRRRRHWYKTDIQTLASGVVITRTVGVDGWPSSCRLNHGHYIEWTIVRRCQTLMALLSAIAIPACKYLRKEIEQMRKSFYTHVPPSSFLHTCALKINKEKEEI